ncbi:MAG: O-antigen ligase family protein [Bacteroidia bacterium]|nr:O-antigen ligase family protein [Bacteroidia bacterium]
MPLSITQEEILPASAITLPSDWVAIGLLAIGLLKANQYALCFSATSKHPLFRLCLCYLAWMLICVFTSTIPLVSLKYWLSTLWYVVGFLFFSVFFFQEKRICLGWFWIVAPSLVFVSSYTIIQHALANFTVLASYSVMQPFYKEHTAYAASLALFVYIFGLLPLMKNIHPTLRYLGGAIALLLLFAITTSYTRGAWIGVFMACFIGFLIYTWKRYKYIFFSLAVLGILTFLFLFFTEIKIPSHIEETSKSKNIQEHLYSVLNTRSDLSNLERINRWVAALNMIEEKPIWGFGPGTYAMQYAPYQQSYYKTHISTNRGDNGSAHNEYLLAASEMGIPGAILLILLFGSSLYQSIKGFFKGGELRFFYLMAACSLITYYTHGLVNNFLDQDKVAIPVYLLWAMIIALDVYHLPKNANHHQ